MISRLAIEDCEDLREKGLDVTPEDIVRLNALGLKIERSQNCGDLYALPRVAYLGNLCFREPTLAHGQWIDRVMTRCNADDASTCVAVRAFAISRNQDDLPDPTSAAVIEKISEFCKGELSKFTFEQIHCAVSYALFGSDVAEREYPEPAEYTTDPVRDVQMSVYVGVLIETMAMSLGLSLRDLQSLTRSQVYSLRKLGFMMKGIDGKSERTSAEADYFRTLAAIEDRLKKEKMNKEAKSGR